MQLVHRTHAAGRAQPVSDRDWSQPRQLATLVAGSVGGLASALARLRRQGRAYPTLARGALALALVLLGLILAVAAVAANVYLHRGIETGAEVPAVVQPTGRVLATNADLTLFAEDDLDTVAETLANAGFRYVRHSFAWAALEPEPEQFAWDRADAIVDALTRHDIQIVAVLHDAPGWARAEGMAGTTDAPPADPGDYARFVEQFVRQYQGRVAFVQLWDLPNRADRWGGTPATAAAYLELLTLGFNAARTANPEVRVLLAELDPAVPGAVGSDLTLLRQLYAGGAEPFFDIAAARIDGGGSAPEDRWVAADRLNLSRAILYREVMLAHGDDAKPVWATSYGWDAGEAEPVSRDEQADFVTAGMERAGAEWPWMGLMFHWAFLPDGAGDAAGYALLNPDGTATPLFSRLSAGTGRQMGQTAMTGFTPMDSQPVRYQGNWQDQHLEGRVYRTTGQVDSTATLRFEGTGVIAVLRYGPEVGEVRATLDGGPLPGYAVDDGASVLALGAVSTVNLPVTLVTGLEDEPHELTLSLTDDGQLTIGGLIVVREVPFLWPVVLLTVAALVALFAAVRMVVYLVATRSGHLQRREGVDLWPQLPHMPDWRPSRRA